MRKITYSDLDSSSDQNLKDLTLYIDDGRNLRMRVVYPSFNDAYREYIEFVPNVLDSSVSDSNNGDYTILIGDRAFRLADMNGDDAILRVEKEKIYAYRPIAFQDSNEGIEFGNGDIITKNPVKWTLMADRNLTDTEVPLFTNGLSSVSQLFSTAVEIMVVANVAGTYVSGAIPTAAVATFPATFAVHDGNTAVASVTFNAANDATYTVTSNADNVKVFMR